MQRSSESIASLAAALAKAQIELSNPKKSLVATIRVDGPGEAERAFRYAPLSTGLDIVRKTLGQHEIATVQTTAIDQNAGIVNLTTVLAHSSGEWIASDWPVCAIGETATPRRMGAALTYARRYALFTLVGIAGEDDLDAPDLVTPMAQTSVPDKPKGSDGNGRLNGSRKYAAQRMATRTMVRSPSPAPALGPEASAAVRDRLVAELAGFATGDDAAIWAHRCLPEKNKLTAADAALVEEAFRAKLAGVAFPAEDSLLHAPEKPEQFPQSPVDDPQPRLNPNLISIIRLAEAAHAFMITIDINSAGRGWMDTSGPSAVEPKTVAQLRELVSATKIPIVIKGIMTPDDALLAGEAGAAGICVSNHGGRVLDHSAATADVLPAIADKVKGKMVILVDGCVHYGTDVLRYLALGADAVLVGRHLWRTAHGGGRKGVALFMQTMHDELTAAMVLTAVPNVAAINRDILA